MHAGFNEIVGLNSASQFIKDDLFLHAVQLFSNVLQARFRIKESITQFVRSRVTTWSDGNVIL